MARSLRESAASPIGDMLLAAAIAGGLSGAPSTLHALATGDDPLRATLAAGSIALPCERRRWRLAAAAIPLHFAISLGWSAVLARVLPPRDRVASGALAGAGIAALDLGIVGRRFERVRSLPIVAQLADHVLFGALFGAVLEWRERSRRR